MTDPMPHPAASSRARAPIVVGTRGSALARWQTDHVVGALRQAFPELQIEVRVIKTSGDKDQVHSLAEIGGLGVFTKEIENALLSREIDVAVHSLKDLPTELATGLEIAAITEREDPRDCLVSRLGVGMAELPAHARVGTSSARRTAQLLMARPDLQILPLRGNVDTRLRKAQTDPYDAVVLAAAGVIRLGRGQEITEFLSLDQMLPDPGQGALAVETRSGDAELVALLARLDHLPTRQAVTAERALLKAMGGGCRVPLGTHATVHNGTLTLRALLASPDGTRPIRGEISGKPEQASELGEQLGMQLVHEGADNILELAPLRGRRIVVTRAREQASELSQRIRLLGGEPIEFPTIQVEPLEDYARLDYALAHVGDYDWVIFTSANGVTAIKERLKQLGASPGIFSNARIAAIGPATSRACAELGLAVAFVPTKYLGGQIAAELPAVAGERALLLRADIASDELAVKLKERGVNVTNINAYRTVAPKPSVDVSGADAVTFTSSSTVKNLVALLEGKDSSLLERAAVFCIGPVTADTARSLGIRVDATATEHTINGLLDTMVAYYQRNQTNA